eukprot:jgi/Mesvir1/7973/Mv11879-RA.1
MQARAAEIAGKRASLPPKTSLDGWATSTAAPKPRFSTVDIVAGAPSASEVGTQRSPAPAVPAAPPRRSMSFGQSDDATRKQLTPTPFGSTTATKVNGIGTDADASSINHVKDCIRAVQALIESASASQAPAAGLNTSRRPSTTGQNFRSPAGTPGLRPATALRGPDDGSRGYAASGGPGSAPLPGSSSGGAVVAGGGTSRGVTSGSEDLEARLRRHEFSADKLKLAQAQLELDDLLIAKLGELFRKLLSSTDKHLVPTRGRAAGG